MIFLDLSFSDLRAIVRFLEHGALAMIASFPAEAVRLVSLASLLRARETAP